MSRIMLLMACPLVAAFLASTANADPISAASSGPYMGNIQMTVARYPYEDSSGPPEYIGGAVFQAANWLSLVPGPVSLSLAPGGTSFYMGAPGIGYDRMYPGNGYPQGWMVFTDNISTTFQLAITFNGVDGSHPQVDVTGTMKGWIHGDGNTSDLGGSFVMTPTQAALSGWSPTSGIPPSLISQYLNPSDYSHFNAYVGGLTAGDLYSLFVVTPSSGPVEFPSPEPSSWAAFLTLFAALGWGIRRKSRLQA